MCSDHKADLAPRETSANANSSRPKHLFQKSENKDRHSTIFAALPSQIALQHNLGYYTTASVHRGGNN